MPAGRVAGCSGSLEPGTWVSHHGASLRGAPGECVEVRNALESSRLWVFPVRVLARPQPRQPGFDGIAPWRDRSDQGRHLVARTGHWVHLDEPGLVERYCRRRGAHGPVPTDRCVRNGGVMTGRDSSQCA